MTKLELNLKPHLEMKNKTKLKIEENNTLIWICVSIKGIFFVYKKKKRVGVQVWKYLLIFFALINFYLQRVLVSSLFLTRTM